MKFVSWIRGAAATAVVLMCAGLAQAQDFGVSPTEGAIGQEITLRSDGAFGARRGKVTLTLATGKRRAAPSARIVSWDADTIVFTIHRATAGPNFITVKPRGRGAEALIESVGVEVLGPQLTGRDGNRFFKGGTLTLSGENFGTVRGKVGLTPVEELKRGTRRPRVTSWTNSTVTVKLPSLGPDGFYDITLTNFAGETSSMAPIELVRAPKPIRGKDRVVGAVGGPFSAVKGSTDDEAYWAQEGSGSLTILGLDGRVGTGGSSLRTLTIVLDPRANVSEIEVPHDYLGNTVSSIDYSKSVERRGGETLTDYTLDRERDFSVRVDNVIDGRMSGTFSATLVKTGEDPGPGPNVLRVRGSFVVNETESIKK